MTLMHLSVMHISAKSYLEEKKKEQLEGLLLSISSDESVVQRTFI